MKFTKLGQSIRMSKSKKSVLPVRQKIRIFILRAAFVLALPAMLFVVPAEYPGSSFLREIIELLGLALVITCVLGRFWCTLYIGGHKNQSVIQVGPYSICRHPLYLFSTLGVTGLGFLLHSVSLGVLFGGATLAILAITAKKEEAFLRAEFGSAYDSYALNTPMILPRISNFNTPENYVFSVSHLRNNLFDALVFLAFIPLAKIIDLIHDSVGLPSVPLF